jgi:iron complex outermembrane receptor protein
MPVNRDKGPDVTPGKLPRGAAAFLALALAPGAAAAQEPEPPKGAAAIEERITVTAPRPAFETVALERDALKSGRAGSLALAFAAIPGVSGVRRARNAIEPVIRGLGWERVQTQVNGLPIHGACAARMDPPATLISAWSAREASVVKGLASVTLGPGGTGGRLVVSTEYEREPGAGREFRPWARLSYDEAGDGFSGGAGVLGGTGPLDYAAGLHALRDGDYTSAAGTLVPAGREESGGFLSLGLRPGPAQRFSFSTVLRKSEWTDYPSLPMDSDWDRDRMYSASYRYRPAGGRGRLVSVEARFGFAPIDHLMSNRRKPTWSIMQSENRSSADSRSAGVSATWFMWRGATLSAGADFTGVDRDALHSMRMTMTGMTSFDHLWPDASQDDRGVFVEHSVAAPGGWRIRAGARYDRVASAAAAADDPGLAGRTVRQNYVWFYGPEAADTGRSETTLSGNVVAGKDLTPRVTLEAGIGVASRAASVTERFFAYAPAPGGYLVGNPALDPERKREVSLGATFRGERVTGTASVFRYGFHDYINGIVLARQDVNGDGIADVIRGFQNVEAVLFGAEVALLVQAGARLALPMSVAYVRGENRDAGSPLAEIPPLEGRFAARWTMASSFSGSIEIGARLVARQARIDEAFGENATPGFAVWHARGRWDVAPHARVEIGIENLLDKEYHEHLTREAALPAGGLAAGDAIPQPARALAAAVRVDF